MVKPSLISRLACALAILSVLAGCSDDPDQTTGAGTTAGDDAAGHGGGQSGAGGQHDPSDASTDMLSCSERETIASNAVVDALVGSELGCTTADDCEEISIDTDCHAACGALVATEHKAEVAAAIATQDATTCDGFASDGCSRVIPPCEPPFGSIQCQDGRCIQSDEPAPTCLEHTIRWGQDGGLVASRVQYVVEPCARFRAFVITGSDPDEMVCDNVVPDDGNVSAADLNALIADQDVQDAIADAPVVFGGDPRPIDGQLLRIEIDGAIIDVGENCDSTVCSGIPAGVTALATALQAVVGQAHDVAPTCMNTT